MYVNMTTLIKTIRISNEIIVVNYFNKTLDQ